MSDHHDDSSIHRRGRDPRMALRLERIVRTMTEIEQGRRPVSALDPVASPMVARRIRAMITEQRAAKRPRLPRHASTRIVASTNSRPSIGAAEGSVVVDCGERARAYVIRLEQEGDRWRIVELASLETGLAAATTRAAIEGRLPEDENGIRRSSGQAGGGFFVNTPGSPFMRITPDDPAYQDPGAAAQGAEQPEPDDRPDRADLD